MYHVPGYRLPLTLIAMSTSIPDVDHGRAPPKLCDDVLRIILEVLAEHDMSVALELAAKSSVCKNWFVKSHVS
jgi:hypothetical protein